MNNLQKNITTKDIDAKSENDKSDIKKAADIVKNDSTIVGNVKPRNLKKAALIFIACALLASIIMGFIVFFINNSNKTAISVNDTSISKEQYRTIFNDYNSQRPDKNVADNYKQFMVDSIVYIDAAKQYNIDLNHEDILATQVALYSNNTKKDSPWQYQVAKTTFAKQMLGVYSGDTYGHFVFPFSKYFASFGIKPEDGLGDIAKIKQNQEYAKAMADKYHQSIANDPSLNNAKKILNSISKDSELNYGFSANNSDIFTLDGLNRKSTSGGNRLVAQDEANKFTSINNITPIETETMAGVSFEDGYNTGNVPIAYFFDFKVLDYAKFNLDTYKNNNKVIINV